MAPTQAATAASLLASFAPILSQALSYFVVFGSFILKVPQILKILRARSAVGISMMMLIFEVISFTIAASYNFTLGYKLMTYAENMIILVQNFVLIYLVARYNRLFTPQLLLFSCVYILWVSLVAANSIPTSLTVLLMRFVQIPASTISRIPQIYTIYKNQSTGQLTVITFLLAGGGCAARLFTTFTTSRDPTLLFAFFLSGFLNAVIVAQFAWYWNSTKSITPPATVGKQKKQK